MGPGHRFNFPGRIEHPVRCLRIAALLVLVVTRSLPRDDPSRTSRFLAFHISRRGEDAPTRGKLNIYCALGTEKVRPSLESPAAETAIY